MKKLLFPLFLLMMGLMLTSCDETTDPDPVNDPGNIFITSTPAGAAIWRDGINSGKVTPDTLKSLTPGTYKIVLQLSEYTNDTVSVVVEGGKTTTVTRTLTAAPLLTQKYTNVRLFEIAATGFSGLDLSTGTAVSSTGAATDIFYNGGAGKDSIYSHHLRPPGTGVTARYTDFNASGTSNNVDDGTDSPVYSSTSGAWKTGMSSSPGNYVFLYDNDLYYSKLVVTNKAGGTGPSDPDKYVDVTFIYNKTVKDKRF